MGHVDANHHSFLLSQPPHCVCIQLQEGQFCASKQEEGTYKMIHAAQFGIDFQSNVGQVLVLFWFDACLGELHVDRM